VVTPTWTAVPDTQLILIGEQIQLSLHLESQTGDTVQWPLFADTLLRNIEIVDKGPLDTAYTGDNMLRRSLHQQLTLTSFDSGYYAVPPLRAIVNGDTLYSRPFLISVLTIPIDSTNAIADIKEIAEDPLTFVDYLKAYWPWLAGGIFVLGLLLLLFFFREKLWPKKIETEAVIPTELPHDRALRRLGEIENMQLWQQGKLKVYHAAISEIIREYIEGRYYFDALEKTTDEIMSEIRLTDLHEKHRMLLLRLLRLTDLVKFAKEHPLPNENKEMMEIAIDLVKQTTPTPNPEEIQMPTEKQKNGHAGH
jgi:hypothetical protein